MKTLAFLLFLMNIGFYVWLQGMLPWLPWQPEQYELKPQTMQLSADVERLMLAGEHDASPVKTIAPEKMRLADNAGVLEETKPRTLQYEAKVSTDDDNEAGSLKAAKLVLAENTATEEVNNEPETPTNIVPSNLRAMSALSKLVQLPSQEQAEKIEETTQAENSNHSLSRSASSDDPSSENPNSGDASIKPISAEVNNDAKETKAEETAKTVIAMAENPEKTAISTQETAPEQIEYHIAKQYESIYNKPESNSIPKTSEQQADGFFSRLAQTVQRVGNTFQRVSNDVFSDRVTVPPQYTEKPQVESPKQQPEQQVKVAAAASKPAQPVKKTSKPVKQICYEIGSYTSITQLNKHANWLKSKSADVKTFIDKKTANEVDKVRVYIAPNERVPAAQQRLIAQNIVMRLRHDGISDIHLMNSNALKNSISLGVFDSHTNAQRRANTIKARGYANVRLKKYYKQQKKYWLIAKMPQTQQIIASKFKKSFKKMRLDKMQPCK